MKIKISTLIFALSIWSMTAHAQGNSADDELADLNREAARLASQVSCKGSYRAGDQIMNDRQSGITIIEELEYHKDREFLHDLIDRAYTVPLFQTDEAKKRAIQAFAEQEYNKCKKLIAEVKGTKN